MVSYIIILQKSNAFQMFNLFSAVSKEKGFSILALKVLLQFGIFYYTEEIH